MSFVSERFMNNLMNVIGFDFVNNTDFSKYFHNVNIIADEYDSIEAIYINLENKDDIEEKVYYDLSNYIEQNENLKPFLNYCDAFDDLAEAIWLELYDNIKETLIDTLTAFI